MWKICEVYSAYKYKVNKKQILLFVGHSYKNGSISKM